jgi:mono/diheme cytochrome c family protein
MPMTDAHARPLGALLTLLCAIGASAQTPAASPDFFESRIRPILVNNCYACHTNSQLGGLRLDSREAMLKGGKSGAALLPGDPDKSLLIRAVRQTEALKMPMGGKLNDAQIDDLVAWVKAGATWPQVSGATATASANGKYAIPPERKNFWSLQPLKDPKPPAVKDARWPRNEIDRFILSHLEQENVKPVKSAGKRNLLRRATLDLTGLSPTPEETAAFLKDTSPDAFAKVVDRLLASPHYGERWGRLWLDVARYGEDDYRSLNPNPRGYRPYPNAYLYRDWVIQAVNDDLPYDGFVKAQLAGDLLDPKTRYKTIPATGFLGLGPWYYDNGAVEVTRADERHDRVDVVTRGFLGLTVACARCHDHKYDPIPTTDYYSLAGVFLNTSYHEYPRVPKSVLDQYTKVEDEIEKKQKMLQEMQNNFSTQLSEALAFKTSNYLQGVHDVVAQKKDVDSVVEARKLDYELLQRWIKYMEKPTDKYKFKESWQAMMKRAAAAPPAEGGGRGMGGGGGYGGGGGMGRRGGAGGAANTDAKKLADEFQANVVRVMLARKDLNEENDIIVAKSLEGTKKKKRANKPNEFITNDDFCPNCGLRLKNMPEDDNNFWTEIFQRELRDSDDPAAMMAMGGRGGKPGVLLFRGWGLESRTGSEAQTQLAAIRNDIEEARKKLEPAYPFVHGVSDVEKPVNLPVAIRGNPENLGQEVPRHFLSMLAKEEPVAFTKGSGRLELAEEILKQPIAMRVIVNRVWKWHFGTGLVDTPSNFGVTGERPTNPELLEYLASSFVKNGMSLKMLHREIMLSSVYQLGTDVDETAAAKDSGNRLYWRFNRKRMEAEQLRDSVLQVSGNLDSGLGGPSADLTPAFTRRTVYGKVSRYKLDEYLQLFDFPAPNISAERRFTTTVPLQRLFLMNSDFIQVESEELAKRIAPEPDNRARIRKAYQLLYGRDPNEPEIKAGIEYLHAEPMREYEEDKNKPPEGGGRGGRGGGCAPATGDTATTADSPNPMPEGDAGAGGAAADAPPIGMGMMGGMFGGRRGAGPAVPATVKYEPSAWGRYLKVLFSSSEFLFIN